MKRGLTFLLLLFLAAGVLLSGVAMRNLVHAAGGTLDQHPYSAIGVVNPADAPGGFPWNEPLKVDIVNQLGHRHRYHWVETQGRKTLGQGDVEVESNHTVMMVVSLLEAHAGMVAIALDSGDIFIRVRVKTAIINTKILPSTEVQP
jgi:hypothetical protein